jgi:hypothetical protein
MTGVRVPALRCCPEDRFSPPLPLGVWAGLWATQPYDHALRPTLTFSRRERDSAWIRRHKTATHTLVTAHTTQELPFTGAAALGAAETLYCSGSVPSQLVLQWGRSLGSCGNCDRLAQTSLALHASMGPQPWELRKPEVTSGKPVSPTIASMGPQPWELRKPPPATHPPPGRRGRFNGAAALGAAETALTSHAVKTVSCELLCESPSFGTCSNLAKA